MSGLGLALAIGGGGQFEPTSVSGSVLWLKADAGITLSSAHVSGWADQSGNGKDATQASAAEQPTLQSSGINSHPAVLFDGVQRFLQSSVTLAASAMTMVYAAQYVSSIGGGRTLSFVPSAQAGDGSGQGFLVYRTAGKAGVYSNPSEVEADSTIADATPFIQTGVIDGAHVTAYLNGTQSGQVVCTDTVTGSQLWLGCGKAGNLANFFQNILLGELVIYSRALTATELTEVHRYLGSRWGITVP